jgi:ERCC4-type nuclease
MSTTVLLKIDNREIKCKDILTISDENSVEYSNLVFGDFQIVINNEVQMIFERKTLEDLLASIKDGRYKNQKNSILSSFHCSQYYYIIEGSFKYKSNPVQIKDKILISAVINTQLRDKIAMFYTSGVNETCELIQCIYNRIKDNPTEYIFCKTGNTVSSQIITKKVKSQAECWKEQLCQIPDISSKTADAIIKDYPTMKVFYSSFINKSNDEIQSVLENIKTTDSNGKQRKISSKIVQNIIQYVLQ